MLDLYGRWSGWSDPGDAGEAGSWSRYLPGIGGHHRRSSDEDHDLNLAAALAQSSKDLEEHEYAVRSVARALTPFCSGMNVPDAPYVLQLPNVLHLATDITGVADKGMASLALAAALIRPLRCAGRLRTARSLIAELEHIDRERYAGPVGWIDANGDGEWAIALRCGQLSETDPRQIRIFAGCGIVAGSTLQPSPGRTQS